MAIYLLLLLLVAMHACCCCPQHPKDKRKIIVDEKLATVFTSPMTMFNMNKQLTKHIFKKGEQQRQYNSVGSQVASMGPAAALQPATAQLVLLLSGAVSRVATASSCLLTGLGVGCRAAAVTVLPAVAPGLTQAAVRLRSQNIACNAVFVYSRLVARYAGCECPWVVLPPYASGDSRLSLRACSNMLGALCAELRLPGVRAAARDSGRMRSTCPVGCKACELCVPPVRLWCCADDVYVGDANGGLEEEQPKPRKKGKKQQADSDDEDADDLDDEEEEQPKRKKARSSKAADGEKKLTGYAKPQKVSEELAAVTGEAEMSRGSVVKWLYAYAKEHDLFVSGQGTVDGWVGG